MRFFVEVGKAFIDAPPFRATWHLYSHGHPLQNLPALCPLLQHKRSSSGTRTTYLPAVANARAHGTVTGNARRDRAFDHPLLRRDRQTHSHRGLSAVVAGCECYNLLTRQHSLRQIRHGDCGRCASACVTAIFLHVIAHAVDCTIQLSHVDGVSRSRTVCNVGNLTLSPERQLQSSHHLPRSTHHRKL